MADEYLPGWPDGMSMQKATIASGAATTEVIATQGRLLVGIFMSAGWDAADIAFKAGFSPRAADMKEVNKDPATVPTEADIFVPMPTPETLLVPYLTIVSVTAGTYTGVNQTAVRELRLLFRNAS